MTPLSPSIFSHISHSITTQKEDPSYRPRYPDPLPSSFYYFLHDLLFLFLPISFLLRISNSSISTPRSIHSFSFRDAALFSSGCLPHPRFLLQTVTAIVSVRFHHFNFFPDREFISDFILIPPLLSCADCQNRVHRVESSTLCP